MKNHQEYAVVVMGAGIAGTALTHQLLRNNIKTLLIGKDEWPTVKLGESLPPSAWPMLKRMGLNDFVCTHQPSVGYQSVWGSESIRQAGFEAQNGADSLSPSSAWKVDKAKLVRQIQASLPDSAIISARIKGVDVCETAAVGHMIHLDEGQGSIRANILVDATGRKNVLSHQLGLVSHQFDRLLAYTVNVPKLRHQDIDKPVFIEAFEQGWGLVSSLDERRNVLSLLTNKQGGMMVACKKIKNWRQLCKTTHYFKHFIPSEGDYPVQGFNACSRIASQLAADNWLLIGDAAMTFDPLSSHGMTTAIYSAEQAAKAIEQQLLEVGDGLTTYAKKMTAIYNTYLNELVALYRSESRWSNSGFWQSKQNLMIGAQPRMLI